MAKINTTNYQPVTAWNGTQDLFVVEQPDGTKVATPEQVKQYVEAGDFEATGEIIDGHGNILNDLADQIDDFALKTWIPQIYDYNTYKRNAPEQKYVKIGDLYVMFMEGTFDFSDISTMIQIRNLPCRVCVGGTIFIGGVKTNLIGSVGIFIQGDGSFAYPRPNVISASLDNASSAPRNKFVFFGYD